MITLNELAYNIKNIAYGGHATDESSISTKQIKFWIHYHRARLIAENLERGILDRPEIYQNIQLNNFNSNEKFIVDYIKDYDLYLQGQAVAPDPTTITELSQVPRDSADMLRANFIVYNSLSFASTDIAESGARTRDKFGQDLYSTNQTFRGDFRNKGSHTFNIPKVLIFDHNKGIGNVKYKRTFYSKESGAYKRQTAPREMMYKSEDDAIYSGHNRFTNYRNEPFYHLHKTDSNAYLGSQEEQLITLNNLRVTNHYFRNLDTPGTAKIYFSYLATANAIFQDPTAVAEKGGYDPRNFTIYNNYDRSKKPKLWDDSKSSYPIPMDMVGDLIQRVIQSEIQPSLKTMPEIVPDKIDDTTKMKISGAQVQR